MGSYPFPGYCGSHWFGLNIYHMSNLLYIVVEISYPKQLSIPAASWSDHDADHIHDHAYHADHGHDHADNEDDYLWRRIAMDCAVNFHLNSSISCGSPLLVHRHFGGSWKDHFHVCIVMMIVDYDDDDGDDDDKTAIDIRHLATPRCCQRGLL